MTDIKFLCHEMDGLKDRYNNWFSNLNGVNLNFKIDRDPYKKNYDD